MYCVKNGLQFQKFDVAEILENVGQYIGNSAKYYAKYKLPMYLSAIYWNSMISFHWITLATYGGNIR